MPKPIKIIHILHHSPSWTSKFVIEDIFDGWHTRTVKALRKEAKFDYQFEVWTPERHISKEISFTEDDILYRVIPSRALNYGREVSWPLISQLHKEQNSYLIIHLHGIFNYQSYVIAQKFPHRPIVAQHHGDAPALYLLERRTLLFTIAPLLAAEHLIAPRFLKNIDWFFCLTNSCIQILKNLGINRPMYIQTMGVDFNKFTALPKNLAKDKMKIPNDRKIILYVGRLTKYKGADKLISAIRELKNQIQLSCLVIGADENDEYYAEAQKIGLEILNRVAHDLLVSYYQAADVFVLPGSHGFNKWGGIGVATIEALATNTPVITGTLQHFPGDYHRLGIWANTTKELVIGIKQILSNPATYNQCRIFAQQYYDWKYIAYNTFSVYNELLNKYYRLNIKN
ncbi:MAG: glycosyltransferase family 4 protein [candidate division WOR-3 bacterium]